MQSGWFSVEQRIPVINTYFFLLLKLYHAIAKSCQKNWIIENKDMWLNLILQRYYKKLLVGNSAIGEVNELKIVKFTFKIFRIQIFHIYNPKFKRQN